MIANNSGAHNAFYRGNDITEDFTSGAMFTRISSGSYKNIFPNDIIKRDIVVDNATVNVTFRVAHLGYYGTGVVLWPSINLASAPMNSSNSTEGGFINSRMYTVTLPAILTAIRNAFGSTHVGTMTVSYPNQFEGTSGKALGQQDYSVYITLPTECQVYGAPIWGDGGYEVGYESSQLAIFRHNKRAMTGMWLRNVSHYNKYFNAFCFCATYAAPIWASASLSWGVKPIFNLV